MTSLAGTLETVTEAFFFERPLDKSTRLAAAQLIASQQGLPGSYAGMFAPLPREAAKGYRTFTGEPVNSEAGARHVLGEEACRALLLLAVPATRLALTRATANFMVRLDDAERRQYSVGTYCCGICSCAYWRQLTAGGLDRQQERLATGMKVLKSRRLENGRWRAFPFWYALLALTEIHSAAARAEKQFAAPTCERYLRRHPSGQYGTRRQRVAELILGQI